MKYRSKRHCLEKTESIEFSSSRTRLCYKNNNRVVIILQEKTTTFKPIFQHETIELVKSGSNVCRVTTGLKKNVHLKENFICQNCNSDDEYM